VGLSPAFAAERRAAAPLLLAAGRAAIDRYILAVRRTAANPQQRRAAAGWDGRTDGRPIHSSLGGLGILCRQQWRQREFKVGGTNHRMGWGVGGD